MIRMFIRHQVNDFETWRTVYDEFAPRQAEKAVLADAIWRSVDDPTDVTVTHDFRTIETARAHLEGEDLKQAMQAARVVGQPSIWFTESA